MLFSEHGLAILKLLCIHSRNEQLNTYMDNGYQVSLRSGNRVTNTERGENTIKHAVLG